MRYHGHEHQTNVQESETVRTVELHQETMQACDRSLTRAQSQTGVRPGSTRDGTSFGRVRARAADVQDSPHRFQVTPAILRREKSPLPLRAAKGR